MAQRTGFILVLLLLASASAVPQSGSVSTLAEFEHNDGWLPSGLVQSSDGNFYGVMNGGPPGDDEPYWGTIFKVTSAGTLSVLHDFCTTAGCTDGGNPVGPLVEGPDGYLYGVTALNCPTSYVCGTVFKISFAGSLATLYTFCKDVTGSGDDENCPDGSEPNALTLGADGMLYGTTSRGGTGDGPGTAFKISTSGKLTTFAEFQLGGPGVPVGALVQATDGNFYGITGSEETVFKLTPGGATSVLYSFQISEGDEGEAEQSALAEGPDGRLYGTNHDSGAVQTGCASGCGSIFSVSLAGAYSTVYQF